MIVLQNGCCEILPCPSHLSPAMYVRANAGGGAVQARDEGAAGVLKEI